MAEIMWIPVSAAAKMLKCSRQRVHKLADEGRLKSQKMESTTLIELRSVIIWIEGKGLVFPDA